jgi:hypothetical protein
VEVVNGGGVSDDAVRHYAERRRARRLTVEPAFMVGLLAPVNARPTALGGDQPAALCEPFGRALLAGFNVATRASCGRLGEAHKVAWSKGGCDADMCQ